MSMHQHTRGYVTLKRSACDACGVSALLVLSRCRLSLLGGDNLDDVMLNPLHFHDLVVHPLSEHTNFGFYVAKTLYLDRTDAVFVSVPTLSLRDKWLVVFLERRVRIKEWSRIDIPLLHRPVSGHVTVKEHAAIDRSTKALLTVSQCELSVFDGDGFDQTLFSTMPCSDVVVYPVSRSNNHGFYITNCRNQKNVFVASTTREECNAWLSVLSTLVRVKEWNTGVGCSRPDTLRRGTFCNTRALSLVRWVS